MDINSGQPWSEMDLCDLKDGLRRGTPWQKLRTSYAVTRKELELRLKIATDRKLTFREGEPLVGKPNQDLGRCQGNVRRNTVGATIKDVHPPLSTC